MPDSTGWVGNKPVEFSSTSVSTGRVVSGSSYAKGKEATATRKFISMLDTLDFDPSVFVSLVTGASPLIQKRILSLLVGLIHAWAVRYDRGMWRNDEELDFLVKVKRVQDALAGFDI